MDNPDVLATLPTQDKGWRQTKPSRDKLKDEQHGLIKHPPWYTSSRRTPLCAINQTAQDEIPPTNNWR